MRHLFYPPYGVWLHADLSQIEMRGAAFVAQDQILIDEFIHGIDRHEDTRVMIDALVGWQKIAKSNRQLEDPKQQRVASKIINFNILFTHDPMTIEYNLNKQGIFGLGKGVLEPLYKEINIKYNNISNYKFIYNPINIIKNQYITNYVRRRRRFDGIPWLESQDALHLQHTLEAIASFKNLEYGEHYTVEDIRQHVPKEIMDLFMEGWNFMVQGPFSGDIPKLIVSCIARKWEKEGVRATPFLTLYDSVEAACHPDDVEKAVHIATPYFLAPPVHLLTNITPIWKVLPLGVDWSCGPSWGVQFPIERWEEDFDEWKKRQVVRPSPEDKGPTEGDLDGDSASPVGDPDED